MMIIDFVLHPHFYAEENLLDRCFMNEHMNGVLPIDEFTALKKHRGVVTQFVFEEDTPIGAALDHIAKIMIEDIADNARFYYDLFYRRIHFLGQGERYYSENTYLPFAGILKYLDPNKTGVVDVEILVCLDAGQVWREDSLRFNMYSHEGLRHSEPHVHVRDIQDNSEASIALYDQEVLCGELSGKKLKKAKKIIKENIDYFCKCWNTKTDGLVIDIDHHFGLINY